MTIICQSCGASIETGTYPADDWRCRGCDMSPVCQSCVDVWGHEGAGLHGKGNPADEVQRLRAIEAEYIRGKAGGPRPVEVGL